MRISDWSSDVCSSDLSTFTVYGYSVAQTLVQALEQCGDDLTRANVMKQAANLKDVKIPMLLPGITVNTGPKDYFPIEQMQLGKFNGKSWELFGEIGRASCRERGCKDV